MDKNQNDTDLTLAASAYADYLIVCEARALAYADYLATSAVAAKALMAYVEQAE